MRKTLVALVLLVPSLAFGQALINLSSLSVRYNSQKTSAKPEGELKAQLDEVDKAIAEARRTGNNGELRRQYAKGITLLNKEAWTPALDYQHSLVLRAERTVADSTQPFALRLEQLYRPAIELTPALTTKVVLRQRAQPTRPGAPPAPPVRIRDLGTFDGVSRDLRESPFPIEVSVAGVADGAYVVQAEVLDGATSLGTVSLNVSLTSGLDGRLRALESGAASVAEAIRADVLYPVDFIKNVNRGRVQIGTFNVIDEVRIAEGVLSAATSGKDPFKGKTGDFERHHLLAGAGEVMPYRVYVPKGYSASRPTPLVIALHGLGANEDSFFDAYQRQPVQLAEKHGFLMAAPLGYRVDGFYGSRIMGSTDVVAQRRGEYSEKDVLEVLRLMKANYNVDESRIYLMGHSMGAIGTWALGAKYPQIWAALVAFAGTGSPALAEQMKSIPQFVVHGDNDPTVNVAGSRNMTAALKKAGATVTYIEVPAGGHSDVVVPNLPGAFEFMAAQRKPGPQTSQK
ncbi:MAG TPA: PHB depolymerase family esterase [Vicinamibacterales bacterium]|nr:PHB depolymerase family esterase [Vicinamibacterales bacterium]